MNRIQLQILANARIRDADTLLRAGQWSGAYYLAGYAIECGLKACIAKLTNLHDYPNRELAVKCYTHKIETLVDVAGLKGQRDVDTMTNPALFANWLVVRDWDEKSRYELWTESQSRAIFAAVTDPSDGVLPWIMVRW